MKKVCCIYKFAPLYRQGIFNAMDKEWDMEWYFGENKSDIKGMDLSQLQNARIVRRSTFVKEPVYYLHGLLKLIGRRDIGCFFALGEAHCISVWLVSLGVRLFRPDAKLYYWTHGWYGKEHGIKKLIGRMFYKLPHGVFLYNFHSKDIMVSQGMPEKKFHVIHNSLDYHKQLEVRRKLEPQYIYKNHFGNDNPTVIFIGRLTTVKKLDLLLKAVAKLDALSKPVNLILVGGGSEKQNLEELANKLGISNQVWFYGACYDETENARLIYNADLCVSPGNVGLTAMHAMTFGTPVLTHNDFPHQMPEFEAIKVGKTGGFFHPDNADDIATKVVDWLVKHQDREQVRRDCYKEIDDNWTPEYQMAVFREHLKF